MHVHKKFVMSSELSYNQVVDLNNAAVDDFECGRLVDGELRLRQAVQAAYSLLNCSATEQAEAQVEASIDDTNSAHGGWSKPPSIGEHATCKQSNDMFIFARIIRLTSFENDPPAPSTYVSFITYNLAVTVHIMASTRSGLPLHFEAACRLYKMSLRRTKQDGCQLTGNQSLLRIGTLNNLGALLYSEVMRYSEANKCFQSMHALLITHRGDPQLSTLTDEELFELTMNLNVRNAQSASAA